MVGVMPVSNAWRYLAKEQSLKQTNSHSHFGKGKNKPPSYSHPQAGTLLLRIQFAILAFYHAFRQKGKDFGES